MDTPSALKGYLYPSSRGARCPKFHPCTVTKKCQNYDQHCLHCVLCESRTNAHILDPASAPLGGHIPEGELYPDIQAMMQRLERWMNKSFAHPDTEGQKVNSVDIANKAANERKIVDALRVFSSLGRLQMEDQIKNALVDPEIARLLGRLE